MSVDASRYLTQIVAGMAFNNSDSYTADNAVIANDSLAAAKTGTLTTRTSNTAGTLTMTTGHGITTGQRLDIYWSGGSCYGATVGTVATNSVPFTGASGTVLPAQDTAITAMVPSLETFDLVGDDCVVLAAGGDAACTILFVNGGTVHLAVVKTSAGAYVWFTGDTTNPIAGDTVTDVYLSHGSSSGTISVRAAGLRAA